MVNKRKKNLSVYEIDGKRVNIICQPKYMWNYPCFWLLKSKLNAYKDGGNSTVLVSFAKDTKYGMTGKVYRVLGGVNAIVCNFEEYYCQNTGRSYYVIPLDKLVEVKMDMPKEYVEQVEQFLKEQKENGEDDISE